MPEELDFADVTVFAFGDDQVALVIHGDLLPVAHLRVARSLEAFVSKLRWRRNRSLAIIEIS